MSQGARKLTGIYRCPDDISNLIIRIQLTEVANGDTPSAQPETAASRTFRWQEKVYGKAEREFYKDEAKCATDLDKKRHRDVADLAENHRDDDVLYSYVDDDDFRYQEEVLCSSDNMSTQKVPTEGDGVASIGYNFAEHLSDSVRNPYCANDFQCMYIMTNLGEYADTTWLKSEHLLCSLKYSKRRKLLLVFPDFTECQGPYVLRTSGDFVNTYHYEVENLSETDDPQALTREEELENKVAAYRLQLRSQAVGSVFDLPPPNRLRVHVLLEILAGRNFEHDDIYVQYSVDLPDCWSCADRSSLSGATYSSRTRYEGGSTHFGYPVEFVLERDEIGGNAVQPPSRSPYVYFEVISKDTWDRFRTEGLTYKALPVTTTGIHQYELQCLRLLPPKPRGDLRRFFVGDCMRYDDVTWIGLPQNYEDVVINKHGVDTTGTGRIDVRINVVHQSTVTAGVVEGGAASSSSKRREKLVLDKLSSSSLLRGADQVLDAFKKARQKMMEARKKV